MQIVCFKPSPSASPCLYGPPCFSSAGSAPIQSGDCRVTRRGRTTHYVPGNGYIRALPRRGGMAHQISEQDTFHCGLFLLRTWVWSCQSLGHFHCDNPPEYGRFINPLLPRGEVSAVALLCSCRLLSKQRKRAARSHLAGCRQPPGECIRQRPARLGISLAPLI